MPYYLSANTGACFFLDFRIILLRPWDIQKVRFNCSWVSLQKPNAASF